MKNRHKILILAVMLAMIVLLIQKKLEINVVVAQASDIITMPKQKQSLSVNENSIKSNHPVYEKITDVSRSTENFHELEKKELLCKLKLAHANVPMQGDVQIFVSRKMPFFANDMNNVAWIKSDLCPAGMYSIVRYSDDSRISQEIDCRSATLTEIATLSGEQGNIDAIESRSGQINLAISGNGYFVLSCPGGNKIITRDGKFKSTVDGGLISDEGCVLLNQYGISFRNFNINESGCNSNQECIATVDPSNDEISGLYYINNYSFHVLDVGQLAESITKKGTKIMRPTFLMDSLEDIHNRYRGLTSVSWINHPHIRLSDVDCQ